MKSYLNGRIKGNNTVHLFRRVGLRETGTFGLVDDGLFKEELRVERTPECGSGNTHNINHRILKRVVLTQDDVTCKKCKAVLYGGKPSDYAEE